METHHISARRAAKLAIEEVGGAIIAITFVMAAVFIPVAFMSPFCRNFLPSVFHYNGYVYYSFWDYSTYTTPALCAMILKNTMVNPKENSYKLCCRKFQ